MLLKDKFRIILIIFSLIGLALALFLAYEYAQPQPIGCPLHAGNSANPCETVRQSEYSKLLGVELPYWGTIFFVIMIVSLIVYLIKKKWLLSKFIESRIDLYFLGLSIFGIAFETYYFFLQLFVIKAVCTWCVMVWAVVLSVFVINLVSLRGSLRGVFK